MQVAGDQSGETFTHLYEQAVPLVEELRASGRPVLGLADLTHKGHYSPGSNKAALQLMEQVDYDRLAVYGAGVMLKEVTELLIMALGRDDRTKVFPDRDAALAWLLAPQ